MRRVSVGIDCDTYFGRSADIASGCLVGSRQITPSARILCMLGEVEIEEWNCLAR
jgi:hypothetical protein